jgi:hypothetical protein
VIQKVSKNYSNQHLSVKKIDPSAMDADRDLAAGQSKMTGTTAAAGVDFTNQFLP